MKYNGKWSFSSTESGTNQSVNDQIILNASPFLEEYNEERVPNFLSFFDNPYMPLERT